MDAPFLDRLRSLRRRIRLLLVLDGIGLILAAGMIGLVTVAAVDYLIWLPAAARLVVGLGFSAVLAVTAWVRVLRPAIIRIELGQVAAALDARFAESRDSLASAADFAQSPHNASPMMIDRVMDQANEVAASVPLDSVILWRWPAIMMIAAVLTGCVVTGVAMAAPWFVTTGLRRYADPFGTTQWPRRVHVKPTTGRAMRPQGGWFETRARILRGHNDSLRVFAVAQTTDGVRERHAMTYEAKNGQYFHVFKDLRADFNYWFEAGDDSTLGRGGRFAVTVVPRPAVVQAKVAITDPAYIGGSEPRTTTIEDSSVAAVEGSRARLTILANKPLIPGGQTPTRVELTLPGGKRLAMRSLEESGRRFAASFDVRRSGKLSVLLVDENGFDNRGGTSYSLSVRQDELPRVVIVEPRAVAEVTPSAGLDVAVTADDDFKIVSLGLRAVVGRNVDDSPTEYDLTDRMQSRRTSDRWMSSVNWPWDLTSLKLKPGDVVTYRAVATDNFSLDGRRHASVRSAEMRLRIISADQLTERVRDELMLLKGALRRMLAAQETARDDAEAIGRQAAQGKPLSDQARESLPPLAGRQTRLASRSQYLAKRFAKLARRLRANRAKDDEIQDRSADASKRLGSLATGPMSDAAGKLQQSGQTMPPADQAKMIGSAVREQTKAAEELRSLLAGMDRWGDFQDVVRHVRQLLDEQERRTESTQRLGRRTLGRKLDDLPAKLAGELKQNAREQRRLAEDLGRLEENMARMAEGIRKTDAGASGAIDAARRISADKQLVARMSKAADDITANRMAQAQGAQRATEDSLREMLSRLQQRGMQQLSELNKKLQRAEERLQALIGDQKKLRAETQGIEATENAKRKRLADRQLGLARAAKSVAEQVAQLDRAKRPAKTVAQAGRHMDRAAGGIAKGNDKQAGQEQASAIRQLDQALETLEKLRAQAEAEMAAKTLGAIADEMEELRDRQAALNERLAELSGQHTKGKSLSRVQLRRLDKLASRERDLAGKFDKLRVRIRTAHVYDWVMRRIGADMGELAKRFDDRHVDARTTRLAAYVLRRIDHLIAGLRQKPPDDMPEKDQFADGGGKGGKGGKGTTEKPVPTVAELLVLKELQSELNRRTAEADMESELDDKVTEQHLEKVRRIGTEQEQIRRLTEQIVQRARQRQ